MKTLIFIFIILLTLSFFIGCATTANHKSINNTKQDSTTHNHITHKKTEKVVETKHITNEIKETILEPENMPALEKEEIQSESLIAAPKATVKPPIAANRAITSGDNKSFQEELKTARKAYIPNTIDTIMQNRELIIEDKHVSIPNTNNKISKKKSGKKVLQIISGYRIQVFATTNFETAQKKKKDLENSDTKSNIYVVYEAPYYKIRLGNFKEKVHTRALLSKLQELGYEAWTIKSKIRIYK